jgi:hypothetical protein
LSRKTLSNDLIVVSASRRTDIPAFFMPWFMQGIERGEFEVIHPYHHRRMRVPARPSCVHTIVFWSKDFGPFLKGNYGRCLTEMGYHLFFQFTINPEDRILEPNVTDLSQRLEQLRQLCGLYGPRAVNWRLDPICFYRWKDDKIRDNLQDVDRIAETAAAAGIRRCTTSFMDSYAKINRRLARRPGFAFADTPREKKQQVLVDLERQLAAKQLQLFTCCESHLLEGLPASSTVRAGACIPNDLLMDLYGGRLSLKRDRGQRVQAGCGCRVSVDVGSYHLHACRHDCLYCYARKEPNKADMPN